MTCISCACPQALTLVHSARLFVFACVCHTNAFGEISCPSYTNAHNQTEVRTYEQASIHKIL